MDVKVKDSKVVYQSRVYTLYEETLAYADGHISSFSYIKHPGACVMVPFLNDSTVLMLRQYRHAIRSYIWEFSAGTMNPGEDPENCARRELVEETGYAAQTMEYWGEIFPLPSYSNEGIHVYKACDLIPARQKLDDDEILSVHPMGVEEAFEMARKGEIVDSKTLACLLLLNLHA